MTSGLNRLMIIGNLGRDPEMRHTQGGEPVTTLSVAVGRRGSTPEGERRDETEWFITLLYDKLAEVANQRLSKGRRVYVEGRVQPRSWDDQDGQRHSRLKVVASELVFPDGSRQSAEGEPPLAPAGADDDLPF